MVFFYLTNISLEIIGGITWWVLYKTSSGIYYIVYGKNTKNIDYPDIHNNDMYEKLIKLQESNQLEIKKLTNEINIMNNYIQKIQSKDSTTFT
tara:strand:- start:571 stop:849 length:279 start_codon:yes stop_codon:yes gene_type:complete